MKPLISTWILATVKYDFQMGVCTYRLPSFYLQGYASVPMEKCLKTFQIRFDDFPNGAIYKVERTVRHKNILGILK